MSVYLQLRVAAPCVAIGLAVLCSSELAPPSTAPVVAGLYHGMLTATPGGGSLTHISSIAGGTAQPLWFFGAIFVLALFVVVGFGSSSWRDGRGRMYGEHHGPGIAITTGRTVSARG